MGKPKIAVLIDWYLPGTKAGGPVRSVYSLVNMLKDEFDFYVITTNLDLGCQNPYKSIAADTLFVKDGIHYYYFSKSLLLSKNMRLLLSELQPDLVYLNSFWSFPFSISVINLKHKQSLAAPLLLAPRGMLGKGAMSLKGLKKRFFIGLAKTMGWYKGVTFHATNEQEEKDIHKKFPLASVLIAPNVNASPLMQNSSIKQKDHLKLFFLSRVAEVKNLHFALEVLKEIPAQYRVDYDIYGNLEDKEYWGRCMQIIAQLPPNVSVSYKGELPFHAVQATISRYNALLLPTLNENFGHSIVESLLCGCPAVISDQTPWNDLEEHGAGFAISLSDKQKFITSLITFAALDQNAFLIRSKAAMDYISTKIDLAAIKTQYKSLFNDCIKNRPVNVQ